MATRCFLLLICLAATVARAQEPQPSERMPLDAQLLQDVQRADHYGVYMFGGKPGWARMELMRLEGPPRYKMQVEIFVKLQSIVTMELRVTQTEEFDAEPPYAYRGGTTITSDGESAQEVRLARMGDDLEVTVREDGMESTRTISAPDYTLADLFAMHQWVRARREPGDSFICRSFDPETLQATLQSHEYLSSEQKIVEGVPIKFHRVKMIDLSDGLTEEICVEEQGTRVLSSQVGKLMEIRLEPEKIAKKPEIVGDLFELMRVRVDRALGDLIEATELVLELSSDTDIKLPTTAMQTFESTDREHVYLLKVGRRHGKPTLATPEEIEDNVKETLAYPIRDERVRALAQRAIGDAESDDEKVRRLVTFVSEYVEDSYTAQPLTIHALLNEREGDCSEHALLLTALARTLGIPAREVSGLIYLGDEEKAFGAHAWCEVVLDGQWHSVDPAWDEFDINAGHIAFGPGLSDEVTGMLAMLQRIRAAVVDDAL